ncbi:MAG: HDOD domain-containing protein [Deltaproteobacteria bacterium]|nr:HDOD domain-containing protein [Deltaproteobacteria bacterium]
MKSVLALLKDSDETRKLKDTVGQEFNITVIPSAAEPLTEHLAAADLVLLDHDFVEQPVGPFLKGILTKFYLPVLILTSYDNATAAVDALREGAYNYLIKVGNYDQVINLVIKEAITKFNEQVQMRQTIVALKKRVTELEEQLNKPGQHAVPSPSSKPTAHDVIEDIIAGFKRGEINLPSLPKISLRFRTMLDSGADFQEILDLLKQDMAISSKLISVSNSAYYRGVVPNKTLEQAIGRLGLNITRQYVDVICNRSLYATSNKKYVDVMERLWEHALSCAFASRIVAESGKILLKEDAFTMGLLHDIGKLLLLQIIVELEIKGKLEDGVDLQELIDTLGTYHGKFGSGLLKRWGFPEGYIHVAQYHDNLGEADLISKELLVVHFANLLVKSMGYDHVKPGEINLEAAESTRLLGLNAPAISEIQNKVKEFMDGELRKCLA